MLETSWKTIQEIHEIISSVIWKTKSLQLILHFVKRSMRKELCVSQQKKKKKNPALYTVNFLVFQEEEQLF